MTVHGAKGLEAPIVVLIDGCEVLGRDPALLQLQTETGDRIPVWSPGKNSDSGAIAAGARDSCTPRATRSTTGCSTSP